MRVRRSRRAQLRTQVLAGVLLITLVALAAFGFAAVTALRGYLVTQTDSELRTVLGLYRPPLLPPVQMFRRHGNFVVNGPVLRLQPPVLDQYYAAIVSRREPRVNLRLLEGNPDLVPRLPALRAVAR